MEKKLVVLAQDFGVCFSRSQIQSPGGNIQQANLHSSTKKQKTKKEVKDCKTHDNSSPNGTQLCDYRASVTNKSLLFILVFYFPSLSPCLKLTQPPPTTVTVHNPYIHSTCKHPPNFIALFFFEFSISQMVSSNDFDSILPCTFTRFCFSLFTFITFCHQFLIARLLRI